MIISATLFCCSFLLFIRMKIMFFLWPIVDAAMYVLVYGMHTIKSKSNWKDACSVFDFAATIIFFIEIISDLS